MPEKWGRKRNRASAEQPTAVAPDNVTESVPGAARRAGHAGPDAADPPLAGSAKDPALDADEGADVFETPASAASAHRRTSLRNGKHGRRDEDEADDTVTLDTPD